MARGLLVVEVSTPLRPLRLSSWVVGFSFWFGMLVLWAAGWAAVVEADRQTPLGNLLRAQGPESSQKLKLSTDQTESSADLVQCFAEVKEGTGLVDLGFRDR